MIDTFLFEYQFQRFNDHIAENSHLPLTSFSSNPYTEQEEGYKYALCGKARKILQLEDWNEDDIGRGNISRLVLKAIELSENNLVSWQARYGEESRAQHSLCVALQDEKNLKFYDAAFFSLFHRSEDSASFDKLMSLFGKKYALLAYLMFLKDRTCYMPIAPRSFDDSFSLLGVELSMAQKCSWGNYISYNRILSELKSLLQNELDGEVSLLDAHSFAWMISKTIAADINNKKLEEYKKLQPKDKEAVVKSRVGQGLFRKSVIEAWKGSCAVNNCANLSLLTASHIKPWSDCSVSEALDPFNGLLLSPSLDAAFDKGLITFDDEGHLLISSQLDKLDADELGICTSASLKRMDDRIGNYLNYHRTHVFQR